MANRGSKSNRGPLAVLLEPFEGRPGQFLLAMMLLLVLSAGALWLWQKYSSRIAQRPEYGLDPDGVRITPPPEWIRADIKSAAIEHGDLTKLKMRDQQLTLQVKQAFSMNPWVRRVNQVRKRYPAQVDVELEYRVPVGMVQVAYDHEGKTTQGVLPVDGDGVLLPPEDLADRAADFPLVDAGPSAWPTSNLPGTPWGDDTVHGAAAIAQVFGPNWKTLKLFKIVAKHIDASLGTEESVEYHLVTREGTHVLWGHAPGRERSGEPKAVEKLGRLVTFSEQEGGLDTIAPQEQIDLRRPSQLTVARRLPSP